MRNVGRLASFDWHTKRKNNDLDLGLLDETPKTNQLEDERFSRMEHFYDSNEIDPETLEDLDLGDDGKVKFSSIANDIYFDHLFRLDLIRKICFIQIEKNSIQQLISMKANIRRWSWIARNNCPKISSSNVPARQLSATELADIEKKVQEIERVGYSEDVDEDDAGKDRWKIF